MDEYDYESDSFDEGEYDEEVDVEPFFGNLLKSQAEIKEQEAKEKEEKREKRAEEEKKEEEEIRKSRRIAERKSVQTEVPETIDDDNFSDGVNDDYDEDHYETIKGSDKKKAVKRDRKCILCSESDPKVKYYTLKGPKCRKDDIEGKLHKMLGTMPVFCLPGNPYICESCYKRTLESYSMWDMSMTGITEYLEEQKPPDIPKSEIKELENKLQRVVKRFCMEKLSHLDEDITIMGNVYVSLSDRAMVMFPIDSTAEIMFNHDDDDDDDDDYNDAPPAAPPKPPPKPQSAAVEPIDDDEPADNSFQNEDLGGILDANMGGGMLYTSMADFDLNFDDIEVDVEVGVDNEAIDFETLAVKREDTTEIEIGTVKKDVLRSPVKPEKASPTEAQSDKVKTTKQEKKGPSVTVNISYKDIQKAEEALIKNNHIEGRCPACKIRYFPGEYIRHTDTSERKKCQHCVFQTSLVCVLRKHEKKNHKNLANNKTLHTVNNSAKALFKCDQCSKCFVTHFLLNKHRIFFHGSMRIYPEYVKSRGDDEILESSDEEKTEEEVAENDPDYCPTLHGDDDYIPKARQPKKKKEKEPKAQVVKVKQEYSIPRDGNGTVTKKRSVLWNYYELTNNYVHERPTARCLLCGREVTRKHSSTWAMQSHIRSFHKNIKLARVATEDSLSNGGNGFVNGDPVVVQMTEKRKGEYNANYVGKRIKDENDSNAANVSQETQFVVGSFGELHLATPDVITALKQKGITITKYGDNVPKSRRLSPTSAAVASITETDEAVTSLLNQSVQISNAEGVNVSMNELLDGKAQLSSVGSNSPQKQYVTQYAKDKNTGGLIEVRIPQGAGPTQESRADSTSGT